MIPRERKYRREPIVTRRQIKSKYSELVPMCSENYPLERVLVSRAVTSDLCEELDDEYVWGLVSETRNGIRVSLLKAVKVDLLAKPIDAPESI